ncbi:hypothetical protein B0H10DRAFT_2008475 [Mycena sp. CBHHK59/15]|nr:hypothetical protein B0H10DRAFT_2008475 [Mycena sp. CBHHK59/15]
MYHTGLRTHASCCRSCVMVTVYGGTLKGSYDCANSVVQQSRTSAMCFLCAPLESQVQTVSAYDLLMKMVHSRDATKRLARFVYEIFMVFEQKEMLIPASHFIRGNDQ